MYLSDFLSAQNVLMVVIVRAADKARYSFMKL